MYLPKFIAIHPIILTLLLYFGGCSGPSHTSNNSNLTNNQKIQKETTKTQKFSELPDDLKKLTPDFPTLLFGTDLHLYVVGFPLDKRLKTGDWFHVVYGGPWPGEEHNRPVWGVGTLVEPMQGGGRVRLFYNVPQINALGQKVVLLDGPPPEHIGKGLKHIKSIEGKQIKFSLSLPNTVYEGDLYSVFDPQSTPEGFSLERSKALVEVTALEEDIAWARVIYQNQPLSIKDILFFVQGMGNDQKRMEVEILVPPFYGPKGESIRAELVTQLETRLDKLPIRNLIVNSLHIPPQDPHNPEHDLERRNLGVRQHLQVILFGSVKEQNDLLTIDIAVDLVDDIVHDNLKPQSPKGFLRLTKRPNSSDYIDQVLIYAVVYALSARGDFAQALYLIEGELKKKGHPKEFVNYLESTRSVLYLDLHRMYEGVENMNRLLEDSSQRQDKEQLELFKYTKFQLLYIGGMYDLALEQIEEFEPDNLEYIPADTFVLNRAYALNALDRRDEALALMAEYTPDKEERPFSYFRFKYFYISTQLDGKNPVDLEELQAIIDDKKLPVQNRAHFLILLAGYYSNADNTDMAISALEQARELYQKRNNFFLYGRTSFALAELEDKLGNKEKALQYLKEAAMTFLDGTNLVFAVTALYEFGSYAYKNNVEDEKTLREVVEAFNLSIKLSGILDLRQYAANSLHLGSNVLYYLDKKAEEVWFNYKVAAYFYLNQTLFREAAILSFLCAQGSGEIEKYEETKNCIMECWILANFLKDEEIIKSAKEVFKILGITPPEPQPVNQPESQSDPDPNKS